MIIKSAVIYMITFAINDSQALSRRHSSMTNSKIRVLVHEIVRWSPISSAPFPHPVIFTVSSWHLHSIFLYCDYRDLFCDLSMRRSLWLRDFGPVEQHFHGICDDRRILLAHCDVLCADHWSNYDYLLWRSGYVRIVAVARYRDTVTVATCPPLRVVSSLS